MKITKEEIESVSMLPPYERYQYFIKRVADIDSLFTVVDEEGRIALADIEDARVYSFWSAEDFAKRCLLEEWSNYEVLELTLEQFEEEVIDQIEEHGYLLNIFPIRNKSGFVVDLDEFARDLSDELEKY